jgi:predicted FMN-binding regulatory protein PaiB
VVTCRVHVSHHDHYQAVPRQAKLSQNRPAADIDGVITGLRESGDTASADAVERARGTRP